MVPGSGPGALGGELESLFVGLGVMDWQQEWFDPMHPDSRPWGAVRSGAPAGATVSPGHVYPGHPEFIGPVQPRSIPDELMAAEALGVWRDEYGIDTSAFEADPDAGEI